MQIAIIVLSFLLSNRNQSVWYTFIIFLWYNHLFLLYKCIFVTLSLRLLHKESPQFTNQFNFVYTCAFLNSNEWPYKFCANLFPVRSMFKNLITYKSHFLLYRITWGYIKLINVDFKKKTWKLIVIINDNQSCEFNSLKKTIKYACNYALKMY